MSRDEEDRARRARAAQRASYPGEAIAGRPSASLYATLSLPERLAAMAALCRAQWEMSGRPIVELPRASWPGGRFSVEEKRRGRR